jgi:hypothetical protein
MTMQRSEQGGQVERYGQAAHREQVEGVVLRDSDLVLPFIQIMQPTSRGEAPAGTFHRKDTGETYKELHVVPLAIQPVRTKFPAGDFDRDSKPECWSDDDITASVRPRFDEGIEVYPLFSYGKSGPRACASCEYNVRFGGSENRQNGMCLPAYIVALLDIGTFETYMLRLQSTNTRFVRVLGAPAHVRQAVMRIGLNLRETATGKWYELTVTAERKLDEQAGEIEVVRGAFDDLRGRLNQGVDEQQGEQQTQQSSLQAGQDAAMREAAESVRRAGPSQPVQHTPQPQPNVIPTRGHTNRQASQPVPPPPDEDEPDYSQGDWPF